MWFRKKRTNADNLKSWLDKREQEREKAPRTLRRRKRKKSTSEKDDTQDRRAA
jgi:hypothetical protein